MSRSATVDQIKITNLCQRCERHLVRNSWTVHSSGPEIIKHAWVRSHTPNRTPCYKSYSYLWFFYTIVFVFFYFIEQLLSVKIMAFKNCFFSVVAKTPEIKSNFDNVHFCLSQIIKSVKNNKNLLLKLAKINLTWLLVWPYLLHVAAEIYMCSWSNIGCDFYWIFTAES